MNAPANVANSKVTVARKALAEYDAQTGPLTDRAMSRLLGSLSEALRMALEVIDAEPPGVPDDVVADIQRQQRIIEAARQDAELRPAGAPASGTEFYEKWARRVLANAGETYRIVRGERVAL